MKKVLSIIAVVFPLLVVTQNIASAEGETIIRQCISENGPIYDLELNPVMRNGNIRLRWQGQDVFYNASIMIKEDNKLTGIAQFSHSMTGETKANPWIFSYYLSENILKDNELQTPCK